MIDRVRRDVYFDGIKGQLEALLDPRSFVGRAPEQVDEFLTEWVRPALSEEEFASHVKGAVKVELTV